VRAPGPEDEANGFRKLMDPPGGHRRGLRVGVILVVAALAVGTVGFLSGWGRSGRPASEPAVVARVNDTPITTRDVDVELAIQEAMRAQQGQVLTTDSNDLRAFRRDILDQLVDQTLMLQVAEKRELSVSESDALAELPKWAAGLDAAALRRDTEAEGVSAAEFGRWARRQVTLAGYLRDDDVLAMGRAEIARRGARAQPVKSGDVASALEGDADVVFFFGAFEGTGESEVRIPGVTEKAPDFSLAALEGGETALFDLRGRPVMLNFWATWCGPCRIEMPLFSRMYDQNRDQGLLVLGIDVQETPALTRPFVKEVGVSFPIVLDTDGQVATLYRVRGLPTTFFISPDGTLVRSHRGAIVRRDQLLEYVREILPSAEP